MPADSAWSANCSTASRSTPGTGIEAPSRYTAKMNSVKRILFRRSRIRNMFR